MVASRPPFLAPFPGRARNATSPRCRSPTFTERGGAGTGALQPPAAGERPEAQRRRVHRAGGDPSLAPCAPAAPPYPAKPRAAEQDDRRTDPKTPRDPPCAGFEGEEQGRGRRASGEPLPPARPSSRDRPSGGAARTPGVRYDPVQAGRRWG